MAGSGFQEGFVQSLHWVVLISQEFSRNRIMAGGSWFLDSTRKESGNL
jgi:hypothetical protein